MTDTTEREPTKLSLRPGKLELKKTVETGKVRQSFSHGRSKTVTVEVKRKRTFTPDQGGKLRQAPVSDEAGADRLVRGLSEQERQARVRALQARQRDDVPAPGQVADQAPVESQEAQVVAQPEPEPEPERVLSPEELAALQAERELQALRDAEAEEARKAEADAIRRDAEIQRIEAEEAARKAEEDKRKAETAAKRPAAERATAARPERAAALPVDDGETEAAKSRRKLEARKTPAVAKRAGESRRRSGKLTITQALGAEEGQERVRSLASVRRARERERQRLRESGGQPQKIYRDVIVPETITVQELANRMAERGVDVVRALMKMGVMASLSSVIDADTAELVASDLGHRPRRVAAADVEIGLTGVDDDEGDLEPRAPVVTIMGHVDHGKTSLLDALRQTDIAAREAGGITQHIGAYQVQLPTGERISFLDTPGHEAFSAMRARGAKVTDIVVLVVAADDSVQPQTVEALNHAKAAGVPIIVAINKIDKPSVDPNRVKTDLLQHSLVAEDMGGEVQMIPVSAMQRIGLDTLLEAILLQAELLELKANPNRPADGAVVEAQLDRGRGTVATVLVMRGTLNVGDIVVAGAEWGRVRALIDENGRQVKSAGPSVPVEILGLTGTPQAGDEFVVVDSEARAREIAEFRQQRERDKRTAAAPRGTLEQLFTRMRDGEAKEVPVVIKADVQGSQEAIVAALEKLGTDEVRVRVLHAGVGGINESDVTLAGASSAFIIGFNVRANKQAREVAQRDGVDIRYYSIIYELIDDMRAAMSGLLAPALREQIIGHAEIREVFDVTKVGKVAGCRVTDGVVKRGAGVRLLRDDRVIHEGKLATLRRFKDDVREVREGFECGMSFEHYQDIQPNDVIECFETIEVARHI